MPELFDCTMFDCLPIAAHQGLKDEVRPGETEDGEWLAGQQAEQCTCHQAGHLYSTVQYCR